MGDVKFNIISNGKKSKNIEIPDKQDANVNEQLDTAFGMSDSITSMQDIPKTPQINQGQSVGKNLSEAPLIVTDTFAAIRNNGQQEQNQPPQQENFNQSQNVQLNNNFQQPLQDTPQNIPQAQQYQSYQPEVAPPGLEQNQVYNNSAVQGQTYNDPYTPQQSNFVQQNTMEMPSVNNGQFAQQQNLSTQNDMQAPTKPTKNDDGKKNKIILIAAIAVGIIIVLAASFFLFSGTIDDMLNGKNSANNVANYTETMSTETEEINEAFKKIEYEFSGGVTDFKELTQAISSLKDISVTIKTHTDNMSKLDPPDKCVEAHNRLISACNEMSSTIDEFVSLTDKAISGEISASTYSNKVVSIATKLESGINSCNNAIDDLNRMSGADDNNGGNKHGKAA